MINIYKNSIPQNINMEWGKCGIKDIMRIINIIEKYVIELGQEGTLVKMQLEEFLLSGKNSFFQLTDIIAKGGR